MFRKYSSIAEVEKILDLDRVSPQKRWVSRTWLADDLAMPVFKDEFREWLKTWPWVTRWSVPFLHPPLRWLDEFRWRRQAKLFAEELKKSRDRSQDAKGSKDAKVVRWQLTKKEVEGLREKIGHYALFYGYPASDAGWESLPFLLYKFAYGQFLEAESQWSTLDMDRKKYILALRCGEKKETRLLITAVHSGKFALAVEVSRPVFQPGRFRIRWGAIAPSKDKDVLIVSELGQENPAFEPVNSLIKELLEQDEAEELLQKIQGSEFQFLQAHDLAYYQFKWDGKTTFRGNITEKNAHYEFVASPHGDFGLKDVKVNAGDDEFRRLNLQFRQTADKVPSQL